MSRRQTHSIGPNLKRESHHALRGIWTRVLDHKVLSQLRGKPQYEADQRNCAEQHQNRSPVDLVSDFLREFASFKRSAFRALEGTERRIKEGTDQAADVLGRTAVPSADRLSTTWALIGHSRLRSV